MKTRMLVTMLVCLILVFVGLQSLQADLITGLSASTNMLSDSGTQLVNVVNGAGLPGNVPALSGIHTAANMGNVWVSGYRTGHVTFDLGGIYLVEGFSLWSFNGNNAISTRDVQVLSSTDGLAFAPVPGAPTIFAQGPWAAPVGPQFFTFPTLEATHIRFNILSNYGHPQSSGLAEVQFDGQLIPEPATMALLGLGMIGLVARRKRKK